MSVGYKAVGWSTHKRVYDLVVVGAAVSSIGLVFAIGKAMWGPGNSDVQLAIRALGVTAILLLHVILAIGPLARLDRRFLPILFNRRHLGVTMFLVALAHAALATLFYHAGGVVNPLVSMLSGGPGGASGGLGVPFEAFGAAALVILFLMAATSHDFWLKNLGAGAWKALHMGVYLAYVLLVLHVVLGAMRSEGSVVYPILMGMGAAVLAGLHLVAGRRETAIDARAVVLAPTRVATRAVTQAVSRAPTESGVQGDGRPPTPVGGSTLGGSQRAGEAGAAEGQARETRQTRETREAQQDRWEREEREEREAHEERGDRDACETREDSGAREAALQMDDERAWVDVCSVDEIPEGRGRPCPVRHENGRVERVAVFKYVKDGSLVVSATTNVCAHQGGPLGEGKVIDGCATCPWHGWTYRPHDGCAPPPFTERIPTYNVRVVAGRVQVEPRALPAGTPVEPARVEGEPRGASPRVSGTSDARSSEGTS